MDTLERIEADHPRPARRGIRFAGVVVATVAVMWVLSSAALLIYTADTRDQTTRELRIPLGTASAIRDGANPLNIPASWDFIAGDELVLVNEDTSDHWIGQWHVAAGGTTTVQLQPVYAGVLTCSLHPAGEISIIVEPAGFDWRIPLFPAFLLGVPVALIVLATRRVMSVLGEEETV